MTIKQDEKIKGYFTGIGSRKTPTKYLYALEEASRFLMHAHQLTLRSGHARGADRACEIGAEGHSHIYLPWKSYGIKPYKEDLGMEVIGETIIPSEKGYPQIIKITKFMCDLVGRKPFDDMDRGVQLLMARNVNQIIGHDYNSIEISRVVLCYSTETGGTGYATALAQYLEIPIINVLNKDIVVVLTELEKALESSPRFINTRTQLLKGIINE